MNFSFKLLLARVLRTTRWGEFMEAIQNVIVTFKADKADRLRDRINLDLAGITDLTNFINDTGFKLPTYDGYTSSLTYLRLRAKSIIYEIRNKLSINSIYSIYKSFFVYGGAYPIQRTADADWISLFTDGTTPLTILDQEVGTTLPILYLDKTDSTWPANERWEHLDTDVRVGYINHLLLSYKWVMAESTTQLWSSDTARAFYLTFMQNKRKRDFYRFQPWLRIPLNVGNTDTVWNYPVYTRTGNAVQHSILIPVGGVLTDITYIQLGTGAHSVIDGTITGCVTPIDTYTVGLDNTQPFRRVKTNSSTTINIEYTYTEWTKLSTLAGAQILSLTECAIFDSTSAIIAYATFPQVNYTEEMLSTILFEFYIQ